ncbi:hypothetical protein C8Q76DRAFT_854174 [Earliella scabrosa]|nr:hypothetical protein C8Q76DRAFT_854174 [Earliella scabrosa]
MHSPSDARGGAPLISPVISAPAATHHDSLHPSAASLAPAACDVDHMRIRERVLAAATSALGLVANVVHELLNVGADVLRLTPVPGLQLAAIALLKIWDALQLVDGNRTACVQLTERCAAVLLSVRAEIADAGDEVALELRLPLDRLVESVHELQQFLVKQASKPFIMRYLDRDEDERALERCHASITEALGIFHRSVQIANLKRDLMSERQRQTDTAAILDSIHAGRGRQGPGEGGNAV